MDAKTCQEYLEQLRALPGAAFAAPEGKSVAMAYSGFKRLNLQFALRDCQADPTLYLITDTLAGSELHVARLFAEVRPGGTLSETDVRQIWDEASRCFAENACGDVQTNIVDARGDWTFRAVELPAFLDNENVTSINGIPVEQLRFLDDDKTVDLELAYEKVCDAELARDQERALTLGSDELQTRAEWKAQALHLQQYREIEHQQDRGRQTEEEYYRVLALEHVHEQRLRR